MFIQTPTGGNDRDGLVIQAPPRIAPVAQQARACGRATVGDVRHIFPCYHHHPSSSFATMSDIEDVFGNSDGGEDHEEQEEKRPPKSRRADYDDEDEEEEDEEEEDEDDEDEGTKRGQKRAKVRASFKLLSAPLIPQ